MTDLFYNLLKTAARLGADYLALIAVGAEALTFAVLFFVSGRRLNRIKRCARKAVKDASLKTDGGQKAAAADCRMRKLPPDLVKDYDKALSLKISPVEMLKEDKMTDLPYKTSLFSSFSAIIFVSGIIWYILLGAVLSAGVEEGLFASSASFSAKVIFAFFVALAALAALIVSKSEYKAARKRYSALKDLYGELPLSAVLNVKPAANEASPKKDKVSGEGEKAEMTLTDDSLSEKAPYTDSGYFAPAQGNTSAEIRPYELKTDMPVTESVLPQAVISVSQKEPVTEPQKEDLIARIERVSSDGAPVSEMKEIAALLKLERAKPENRTPARKKKLDDAYAKFLKAVGGAKA